MPSRSNLFVISVAAIALTFLSGCSLLSQLSVKPDEKIGLIFLQEGKYDGDEPEIREFKKGLFSDIPVDEFFKTYFSERFPSEYNVTVIKKEEVPDSQEKGKSLDPVALGEKAGMDVVYTFSLIPDFRKAKTHPYRGVNLFDLGNPFVNLFTGNLLLKYAIGCRVTGVRMKDRERKVEKDYLAVTANISYHSKPGPCIPHKKAQVVDFMNRYASDLANMVLKDF